MSVVKTTRIQGVILDRPLWSVDRRPLIPFLIPLVAKLQMRLPFQVIATVSVHRRTSRATSYGFAGLFVMGMPCGIWLGGQLK